MDEARNSLARGRMMCARETGLATHTELKRWQSRSRVILHVTTNTHGDAQIAESAICRRFRIVAYCLQHSGDATVQNGIETWSWQTLLGGRYVSVSVETQVRMDRVGHTQTSVTLCAARRSARGGRSQPTTSLHPRRAETSAKQTERDERRRSTMPEEASDGHTDLPSHIPRERHGAMADAWQQFARDARRSAQR